MPIKEVLDNLMPIPAPIESAFVRVLDAFFERWPQPMPSLQQMNRCKLIAHRGEHRDGEAQENTMAAFDRAAQAGVWGLELDVRWTKDMMPVVCHDNDMLRLHGDPGRIDQILLSELNHRFPAIPTLEDIVNRYGRRQHLMIELKASTWRDLPRQEASLCEVLHPLEPNADYHLLALSPGILSPLTQIPPQAKVPIGYYLPGNYSRWVGRHRWGGLCGNYLTMRRTLIVRHQRLGQKVGTGFINSHRALWRELNRGVDWIFSDNAIQLQAHINAHLMA